jgi:hypothetical protein
MRKIWIGLVVLALLMWKGAAFAKVDLVILPERKTVQLTIYNSADLTLVRESRALTLKTGLNRLEFSWANTLIDPTSLEMLPKGRADAIDILDLAFPPRVRDVGLWNIRSRLSGEVPVEISYLTSGLTWRAFYMGTLTADEKAMHLKGYVRVTNRSGEDYEKARVRLVVGKVNLIDQIAELARREYPYGSPLPSPREAAPARAGVRVLAEAKQEFKRAEGIAAARPKEIIKEGLSEYFLFTIEGTETIPNGWSKRLPSFDAEGVPVINLYKFDEDRFGDTVIRFLSFKNDKDHRLGDEPIPGGALKVYRKQDQAGHLAYEGESRFKYIPVNQDVELNLGAVDNVLVKPTLMDYKTARYLFDKKGDISGWDEIREFKIDVKNTRPIPVRVEVTRHFSTLSWDLEPIGGPIPYEKVDLDTIKYSLNLVAGETKTLRYILVTHHGQRANQPPGSPSPLSKPSLQDPFKQSEPGGQPR